ncbi:MAG: L-ribulose-5-phosphate 4-epimerase AraD [Spirochaetaceae bacterium]|nr:MAG: L-ribulose-5-phosphate 4-epimerase AraD [Spirochaetaceae bacterium]
MSVAPHTIEQLREQVYRANLRIVEVGLVLLTWGNASAVDRQSGTMLIKPSGVDYADLGPHTMVQVALADGSVADGGLRPSSDTETHLEIYRAFPNVGGIIHTHSHYAVCFAQAEQPIPCFGTTHADHFHGSIPVTRRLSTAEITEAYERHTGRVIVECFESGGIDPDAVPGVIVAHHGPFAWGASIQKAVENAIVLEEVARMGYHTRSISPLADEAPQELVDKHYLRKHGAGAYYGQTGRGGSGRTN